MRRIGRLAGGVLAILVIVAAVLLALAQLLVPLAAHYPRRVAHVLSEQLHQPVYFASMEGHWQPSGPLLVLHQVRIGGTAGHPALVLPRAEVKLDLGAFARPTRHWINLRLRGLKLTLQRDTDGRWHVAGFGASGSAAAHRVSLRDLPGNLWLADLEVDIDDVAGGRRYRVRAGPIRVSNGGGRLRFAGVFHRGRSGRAVNVVGDMRDAGATGRLYLGVDDADLGRMLAGAGVHGYTVTGGRGDLHLWMEWKQRKLDSVLAHVHLNGVDMHGRGGAVHVPTWKGWLQYRHQADRTSVLLAPGDHGAAQIVLDGRGKHLRARIRAHDFDPGGWLSIARMVPQVPLAMSHWLAGAKPHVHLASLQADWSRAGGLDLLKARFDHLGFAAADGKPGVDHLHGLVRGDSQAFSLQLPAQALTFDYRPVFRWPFHLSRLAADAAFWHADDGWHVGVSQLGFDSKSMRGKVRGSATLPPGGGAPALDLYAYLSHGDVKRAKRFWPVTLMAQSVVDWLDHGFVDGSIHDAALVFHGNTSHWPFVHHKGRFEVHTDISGLKLDYLSDWPSVSDLNVSARFLDNGMSAKVSSARLQGVKVSHAAASIDDFIDADLKLMARGGGKAGDLLRFVRTSAIGKKQADVLKGLHLDGRGTFDVSLVVPLSETAPKPFALDGKVRLHDVDVTNPAWKLRMDDLDGRLHFDQHGMTTDGLTARFRGQPVKLNMNIGGSPEHPSWPVDVGMRGRFTLAELAQGRDQLTSLASMAHGSAPFDVDFHIAEEPDKRLHATRILRVRSNLRGMALDLPAPLHKSASELLPLEMRLGLPLEGGNLRVVLGNRLYARARLPEGKRAGAMAVRLGGGAPHGPLPASGIRVRGHASRLDISGWIQHALASTHGIHTDVPASDVELTARRADIFGSVFRDLQLQLHSESKQWKLSLGGPDLDGDITVPLTDADKRGIVARFKRLYWPRPEPSAATGTPAPATSASSLPPSASVAAVGVNPARVPPLHVWVGDLRFGDARLGQARLESWPTTKGMHIDMLRAQSPAVHVSASGDWNGSADASQTDMELNFSAQNLGKMLTAFGYNGLIEGGVTRVQIDAAWPGAPSSFNLANLKGKLSFDIGKGRIPEVKPGVGRLFGLMSIVDLPRRLSMDFGDVFGKGLAFDSIRGHFRFDDGKAHTEDMRIKGPAVSISVAGSVDFRHHRYNQYVLAVPHLGNSLPIVGAAVGGPIGAAAGFAVQGLLGKGLNKAASAQYHISGPWKNPEVTVVAKHGHAVPMPVPASATSVGGVRPAPGMTVPVPATATSR